MFFKGRKWRQGVCCLLAALCLSAGCTLWNNSVDGVLGSVAETTIESTEATEQVTEDSTDATDATMTAPAPMEAPEMPHYQSKTLRFAGVGLFLAAAVSAVLFLLQYRQERPYLGPELEILLIFLLVTMLRNLFYAQTPLPGLLRMAAALPLPVLLGSLLA